MLKFIFTCTELKAEKEQGRMKYLFQALMMGRLYLQQKPYLIDYFHSEKELSRALLEQFPKVSFSEMLVLFF